MALSKYRDEVEIRAKMEKLKEEYVKKYLEQEKLIRFGNNNFDFKCE